MEDKLMSVSCDPMCGFKVQSHDMDELRSIVKAHVMEKHGKSLTDEEINGMMNPVEM